MRRFATRGGGGAAGYAAAVGNDEGDAGVQSIGSGVVDAAPGDHFELIAHQTSGATKNLAADELTCLL